MRILKGYESHSNVNILSIWFIIEDSDRQISNLIYRYIHIYLYFRKVILKISLSELVGNRSSRGKLQINTKS